MVADEVHIDTLSYQENAVPVHWECDGGTEYSIKKGRTLVGGTGYDVQFTKVATITITGSSRLPTGSSRRFAFETTFPDGSVEYRGFDGTYVFEIPENGAVLRVERGTYYDATLRVNGSPVGGNRWSVTFGEATKVYAAKIEFSASGAKYYANLIY